MYRNRALLDLCHEAPCLLLPGRHECEGASEPCHSDMIRHGRGEHHKSHDCFAVPGCHNAHLAFTRSNLGKEGYHTAWVEAMECYILWQWASGKVRLADITQRAKETAMEAPHCKICDHNHWAREPHILPANAPAEKRSIRNTSREGRDVVKPKGTSTERDHRDAQPATATPGKPAGKKGQRRAAKPTPGKRKPRTKIIATYTPPATAKKGGKKQCAQS